MLKRLIFAVIISLVSCSVDELPSCNGIGIEGEICKEYQYVNGDFNGSNQYFYDLDTQLKTKTITKGKNGNEEGSTLYAYDSLKRISQITLEDINGRELSVKTLKYSDSGFLILEKIEGQLNTTFERHFENNALVAETYMQDGGVLWVDSLEYFSGTESLYRKIRYSNNSITQIIYFEDYSNNVKEEKITDANGMIQSRKVLKFDENDNILEELIYSESDLLVKQSIYSYENGLLERVVKFNGAGVEFERFEYQRF